MNTIKRLKLAAKEISYILFWVGLVLSWTFITIAVHNHHYADRPRYWTKGIPERDSNGEIVINSAGNWIDSGIIAFVLLLALAVFVAVFVLLPYAIWNSDSMLNAREIWNKTNPNFEPNKEITANPTPDHNDPFYIPEIDLRDRNWGTQ